MKVIIRQKSGMKYLYADVTVSGIRAKCTLGISIKVGKFNLATQSVEGEADVETNILLNDYRTEIFSLIRQLQRAGTLSSENITGGVKQIRTRLVDPHFVEEDQTLFINYIKKYISRSQGTKKKSTLKQYNNSLSKLEEYQRILKKKLKFEDIDHSFYDTFLTYCMKGLSLSNNSIGNLVKGIKLWMNAAYEEGLHTNMAYTSKTFKKPTEDADTIYLSEAELQALRTTILPSNSLVVVRDFFLLACYTGVRSQDYNQLNKDNLINNGTMFKVRTEKTDAEVIIPLHPLAKEILDKYNGVPRSMSLQKFNEYIKTVCKIAKITEPITFTRTIGGAKIRITKPKYDCVSSHTARRSFATNAYKAGLPSLAIMAITGHTTEKVFLKYIKVTKEEHALLSSCHPFFSGKQKDALAV